MAWSDRLGEWVVLHTLSYPVQALKQEQHCCIDKYAQTGFNISIVMPGIRQVWKTHLVQ